MSLVSDIITQAFLDLNAIDAGGSISTSEQNDALLRLNQMLGSWSTEQVSVYNRVHEQATGLVVNQATYAIGLGADGATLKLTHRPVRIAGCEFRNGPFTRHCDLMSFERFSETVDDSQGLFASMPAVVVYDNAFPVPNVRFFPPPNSATSQFWVDYWYAFAAFGINDTINMPPGYEDALHFNLALRLYPQYGRTNGVDPVLVTLASDTKNALVRLNASILGLTPAPVPAATPGPAPAA